MIAVVEKFRLDSVQDYCTKKAQMYNVKFDKTQKLYVIRH